MKLSGGKRVLMFIHWLFSLLICAGLVLYVGWPGLIKKYYDMLAQRFSERILLIAGIALAALYLVVAIAQLVLIFKRRKRADRGFIVVDSSDSGRVRLAISAIEQMVRQSVTNIDGISDMKIAIDNQDDAIQIGVLASIVSGSHVPTITMNMQHAIRQFVEMNCGVAVRAVSVTIKSVTASAEGKGLRRHRKTSATLPEAPAATPVVPAPGTYEEKPVAQPTRYAEPEPQRHSAPEPSYSAPKPEIQKSYVPEPEPVSAVVEQAAPIAQEAAPEYTAPADDPIARYFADVRAGADAEDTEAPEAVGDDDER